ncbi:hypothetical protein SAMN06295888_10589 [Desulfonatronum zhilinae]|nr:hypothetical protein SAMN06295888_10589 [Desulfonatronum zhilinae]
MVFSFSGSSRIALTDRCLSFTPSHNGALERLVRVDTLEGGTIRCQTLDANHPLAGENLTFDLEVVEVA